MQKKIFIRLIAFASSMLIASSFVTDVIIGMLCFLCFIGGVFLALILGLDMLQHNLEEGLNNE